MNIIRRRSRVLIVAFAGALLAAGCAAPVPEFVLVNRTEAVLAFAPGVVVAPCSEADYSEQALRAAGEELVSLLHNDIDGDEEAWIPAGAVPWEGMPGRRIGSASPMTYVISGSEPAYVEYGQRVHPLPACEGEIPFEAQQPDTLVIVNRSDATIALLPGMVIAPCSEVGFTDAQIHAAMDAYDVDDDSWIPEGAVRFTREFPSHREGDQQTVIISGAEGPRSVIGPVPADGLPACGGAPVGISD